MIEQAHLTEPFIFRIATPEDNARVLELFRASFNRELPADWWHWFSYTCPTGRNRTTVIEDVQADRLVGSYSLLPIRLLLNGKEYNASLCTNVNTHPDYQGRGLFTRIGQFALAQEKDFDTPISLGMPNQKAYPGHMKVGWDVLCRLSFLVKHDTKRVKHNCRQIETFDERFDSFFERIASNYSLIVMKDHHYMNWRVAARPDAEYTKFIFEEDGALRGYVILKHFEQNNYLKSHILDIQAESHQAFDELIAAAESFADGRNELNTWTNPHDPYKEKYFAHGFHEKESQDLLIIHFNYGDKIHVEEGAWWFCLADNDVY